MSTKADAGLNPELTVAFVGFGEAGSLLAQGLAQHGLKVRAFDALFEMPGQRAALIDKAALFKVTACKTMASAVRGAHVVVSAVTPASAMLVASEAGKLMKAGQVFLDINSVSPETRRGDQRLVEIGGADYIEAALMAPVPGHGIKVPMLLGGRRSTEVATLLTALGMKARAVSTEVGMVSAIKMCRSVMMKGLEALTVECMAAARHYGVEEEVLAALGESYPGMGWADGLAHVLIGHVAEDGERQAIEMREVSHTLRDAGVPPHVSEAAARVQEAVPRAMRERGIPFDTERPFDWITLIDQLSRKP